MKPIFLVIHFFVISIICLTNAIEPPIGSPTNLDGNGGGGFGDSHKGDDGQPKMVGDGKGQGDNIGEKAADQDHKRIGQDDGTSGGKGRQQAVNGNGHGGVGQGKNGDQQAKEAGKNDQQPVLAAPGNSDNKHLVEEKHLDGAPISAQEQADNGGSGEEKLVSAKEQEKEAGEAKFKANDEPEDDKNKIVATNYLTGEELTKEQTKTVPLIAMEHEGMPMFQATINGAVVPVLVHFVKLTKCTTRNILKAVKQIYSLMICQDPIGGKCDEDEGGVLLCFEGKMDPANRPDVADRFQLKNNNESVLAARCNENEELKKQWMGITGKDSPPNFHAIEFKTDGHKIFLAASFHNQTYALVPYANTGCVELEIGSEESELLVRISHAQHRGKLQTRQQFEEAIANAELLSKQDLMSVLAINMLAGFNRSHPALAFVSPKSGKCEMSVSIVGDSLKPCLDQNCTKIADTRIPISEQRRALYKEDFANMVPILKPSDLPEKWRTKILLEKEAGTGRIRALITSKGWEVPFALLTKDWKPPNLTIFRPPNAAFCTSRGNFEANNFVLGYDARPDCYGIFAWGQLKLRYQERNENGVATEVVPKSGDVQMTIEGSNEFWVTNQYGEREMLGRGTCFIKADQLRQPIDGKDKSWKFLLNPQRGEKTYTVPESRCLVGFAVYLDEVTLMVPK